MDKFIVNYLIKNNLQSFIMSLHFFFNVYHEHGMGKAKKRNFYKCKYTDMSCMSRQGVIDEIIADLNSEKFSKASYDKISLFGLSAEELSENGAKFEDLMALKHVLN